MLSFVFDDVVLSEKLASLITGQSFCVFYKCQSVSQKKLISPGPCQSMYAPQPRKRQKGLMGVLRFGQPTH